MLVLLLPSNFSAPLLEVKTGGTGEWITHDKFKSIYYAKKFLLSLASVKSKISDNKLNRNKDTDGSTKSKSCSL